MSFLPHQAPNPRPDALSARASAAMKPGVDGDAVYFLADVARLVPRGKGKRPVHVGAILRWISKGLQTPAGIIRLEAARAGGRWLVSAAALRRFTERLTQARQSERPASSGASGRRLTQADLAEAELQEPGV